MNFAAHRPATSRGSAASGRARGLVLLEVVVSLGILLVTMAVIGAIFRYGQQNVELSEKLSRGMIMTERLIAELDTNSGLITLDQTEQSGFFRDDETIPGMSWKIRYEPSRLIEGLLEIDVDIFMGDPDGSAEEREFVMSTRFFRAMPRGLDLENDFGLDQDQLGPIMDSIPGGSQLIDPNNFDPRALASLDMDTLIELLPTLLAAFGQNFGGGQLDQIIQAIQSGDTGALRDIAGRGGAFQGGGQQGGPGQ